MSPSAVSSDPQSSSAHQQDPASLKGGIVSLASDAHHAHEEYQYLDLIRNILDNGEHRPDRTGTGTYSLFAPPPLRFSLSKPSASSSSTSSTSDPSTTSTSTAQPSQSSSSPRDAASDTDAQSYTPILPLLTTKRVFLRAVIAELLWFVSGCTSSVPLSEQGIRIWDGNGSREFLDSVGLSHREVGDLGPVYGFQWRHFGAEYVDARADYTGQGVDQLAEVIDKLKNRPYDRRIILSAWNPADIKKMALPPCHMFAQFYVSFPSKRPAAGARRRQTATTTSADVTRVSTETAHQLPQQQQQQHHHHHPAETPTPGSGTSTPVPVPVPVPQTQDEPSKTAQESQNRKEERGVLHCQLYQRSCDMGLGVPFNIASYALLTHMLAHVCDLVPGTFTHTMGDAHVYLDHVDALTEQLQRDPREFPTLDIKREKGGSIDGWRVEDFEVKGYSPHKGIAMKMSV